MAKYAAKGNRIYLDQYDLSGFLNGTTQEIQQELPTVTAFSDEGPRRKAGNYDVQHNELGLFDGDNDSIDEILDALRGSDSDHYLTKLFGASAEGGVAYDSVVSLSSKPLSAQVGGAVLLNFDAMGTGGVSRGLVLGNGTSSTAGNGTGYNQGAKSSGPLYRVIFRLLAIASGSITLKLQESQDDAGSDAYADITGLTSGALSAPGIVVVTSTAAIEAWKRVVRSGTFSGARYLVTAGVVAGTS